LPKFKQAAARSLCDSWAFCLLSGGRFGGWCSSFRPSFESDD